MDSVEKFKSEFLRIYEQIAERRGLSAIIGRIMGSFFLHEKEMNQKELSEKTGYSISSISRSLDQMIQLGIVSKHKHSSREYYIYKMSAGFLDLALKGISKWIQQAELSRNKIKELSDKMQNHSFSPKQKEKVTKFHKTLNDLEQEMKIFIEIMKENLHQLDNLE
jgi:DNA-binding transcriptional regulator GbsR (MarR family)